MYGISRSLATGQFPAQVREAESAEPAEAPEAATAQAQAAEHPEQAQSHEGAEDPHRAAAVSEMLRSSNPALASMHQAALPEAAATGAAHAEEHEAPAPSGKRHRSASSEREPMESSSAPERQVAPTIGRLPAEVHHHISQFLSLEDAARLTRVNTSHSRLTPMAEMDTFRPMHAQDTLSLIRSLRRIGRPSLMTCLDLSKLSNLDLRVLRELLRLMPNTTQLKLNGPWTLTSAHLLELPGSLTHLELVDTTITDLRGLHHLSHLVELNLSGNTRLVSLEGMPVAPNLRTLSLSGAAYLPGEQLALLAGSAPGLQNLRLEFCSSIDEAATRHLSALPLEYLALTEVQDLEAEHLPTTITRLVLSGGVDLRLLEARLPDLTQLHLVCNRPNLQDLPDQVEVLRLDFAATRNSDLLQLARKPNLRELEINECERLTAHGIQSLIEAAPRLIIHAEARLTDYRPGMLDDESSLSDQSVESSDSSNEDMDSADDSAGESAQALAEPSREDSSPG
jgi:hypothetical protein